MNLTRISIERPKLVVVTYTLILLLGVLSYFYLSYELVPRFTPPVLTVVTVYPGASPAIAEKSVTMPVEDALSSLEGVQTISSYSQENLSIVRIELEAGTDVTFSLQEASRKIQAMLHTLPDDAGIPVVSRFDFDDLPVMRMAIWSDLQEPEFSAFVRDRIVPYLNRVEGVAQVRLLGDTERQIRIEVDPAKLAAYGLSLVQVLSGLQLANLEVPAGALQTESEQTFIRFAGRFGNFDQIRETVLVDNPMQRKKVRLGDVATVLDAEREPQVITRINGRGALGLDIRKQTDANAVDMSRAIRKQLARLEEIHAAEALRFEVAQDTSGFTVEAANAVMKDLLLAVLLVSLIMLVFLHSLRNSLFVLVSIPTSVIATFVVMYALNYSLNMLTLLGLSLAIGILVDDSIVVIENIYRHIEMGKDRVKAAFEGREEIGFTAISITLIDVVVFLPIVFSSGLVADLLRQFSVVIITSTLLSLLVSFTLVPLLASRFARHEQLKKARLTGAFLIWFESMLDRFINRILLILRWAFDHRITTLVVAHLLLLGAASLFFFGFIGLEFTRAGDRSEFLLELELSNDATLQETNRAALRAESLLLGMPEVTSVFTTVGITSSGSLTFNTEYLAELTVRLVDKRERGASTALFARHVKKYLTESLPGVIVRPMEINLIGLRDNDAVQVTLTGNDELQLETTAGLIQDRLQAIPGAVEIWSSGGTGRREIMVELNRPAMNLLGVQPAQVGAVLRTAFYGNTDLKYRDGEEEYDIEVILDAFNRRSAGDIGNLSVINSQGRPIRLKQFTDLTESQGLAMLERSNRMRSITIQSQVIGRPAGSVGSELQRSVRQMELPEGISLEYGGQTRRTADGLRTMLYAFGISVLLVYFILVALYDSYYYPLVVLFSLPLALIGALLALALSNQALSIFSAMGLVILAGLVGKNAILVVDFTNNLRAKGMDLKDALIEATRLRFRPILMTNITMIIGLMPIGFAAGAGSEWKNGLAWALIGGLSSSMLLTLVVVPVLYHTIESALDRWGFDWGKKVRVPKV
jgi:hydrophobic/amphiphilic exporter-1 (mainly G- bacteria), HAE1 family